MRVLILGWWMMVGMCLGAERPNVVFLIADDLSAQALGCYGNEEVKTPNIDALAKRGMKWTAAYCQFPVCGPSRAALMSGLYPQQNGVVGNGSSDVLTKTLGKRPTMPEYFKKSGWHSARVSKIYHMRVPGDITAGVDGPDHAASWTEKYNCKAPEWMTEGPAENIGTTKLKFDREKHYGLGFGSAFYVVKGTRTGAEQADYKAAVKAMEILDKEREEPLFLAVGFVRPHVPLVAPEKFYAVYPPEKMSLPEAVEGDREDIPKLGRGRMFGIEEKPREKQKVLSAYYASVTYMDEQVGKVMKQLKASGMWDKTIVVFTSDHGYHLGEHDFWQKMSLHEESVRVPLIIAGPGIKSGSSDRLVEAIDLYPTLVSMAGLEVPAHCMGVSLQPHFANPGKELHKDVYCLRTKSHLLRTKKWAFMQYKDGSEELYDMEKDPRQFVNLAEKEEKVVAGLKKRLEERLAAMKD